MCYIYMEKVYNKVFEKVKKISLDMDERFLKVIDELVKLTKTNRTLIIEALIGQGMAPFFKYLENTWKGYSNEGKWDKNVIKMLLQNLKKIKGKYV